MKQKRDTESRKSILVALVALTLIGAVLFGLLLVNKKATTGEVFDEALANQLKTTNIYRDRNVSDGQATQSQVTQVTFADRTSPVSRDYVVVKNSSNGQETMVETEAVGTKQADYVKYVTIEQNGDLKSPNILGRWAMNEGTDQQSAQFLEGAFFSSPLMTGPVDKTTRDSILKDLKSTNAIKIEKVDTKVKVKGRQVYKYTISINLKKYIPIFQTYLKNLGMESAAKKLTVPPTDSQLPMIVYVDSANKRIVKVENPQDSEGSTEIYAHDKFIIPPAIPTKINLSVEDLQSALSSQ